MNKKLRDLRLTKGLSQENIAFELGISQKAYSKIENCKVNLSQEKMEKISKILEVSPDYFCTLTCECSKINSKFSSLLKYIEERKIELPNFLK